MKVDFDRMELVNAVANAENDLKEAKLNLLYHDHYTDFYNKGISIGKAYIFGSRDSLLVSDNVLESCVIDNGQLKRVSPIAGGSDMEDMAIYRCKKCSLDYLIPLNPKDKEMIEKERKKQKFLTIK